jgi:hypothetical protein
MKLNDNFVITYTKLDGESVTRKGYDLLNRMYISSQISKQTGEIINEIAKTEKLI